jgi:hypothetical protein
VATVRAPFLFTKGRREEKERNTATTETETETAKLSNDSNSNSNGNGNGTHPFSRRRLPSTKEELRLCRRRRKANVNPPKR